MRAAGSLIGILFAAAACAIAQDPPQVAGGSAAISHPPADLFSLEFGRPKLVMNLPATSGMAGRFKCGSNGSIVTMLDIAERWSDASGHPMGQIMLAAINLDGQSVRFSWGTVPGFKNVRTPRDVFAGNDKVYLLTSAERDLLPAPDKPKPISIILEFDANGELKKTVQLDPRFDPLSFGVYPSGDFILVSEDRLNRRMDLAIMDSNGSYLRDLRLFDSDYIQHGGPSAEGPQGKVNYSSWLLAGLTQVYAYGEDLLLVPNDTSGLPMIEVNESGIVRSTVPQLPKGSIQVSFLPSGSRTWKIQLGALDDRQGNRDSSGTLQGLAVNSSTHIVEIDPSDGGILKEIDFGDAGVAPACESDGEYTFLTTRDNMLQIVTATLK